jgi:hypothetical protein
MNNNRNNNRDNIPSQPTPIFRNEDLSEYRLYLLINEFMQDYYANIRLYQENVRDMIQLLREFRTNTHPRTNIRANIHNPFRQPMQQSQHVPPQIPRQNNIPPLETNTFAYFIQPFNNEPEQSIGLTSQQIENAIETVVYDESISSRYNESDEEDTSYERCPICLEDFQIGEEVCRIRICGHIFKRPGLMYWFSRNNHCPVCRRDVSARVEPTDEENQIGQSRAIDNLVRNHIGRPLLREFNNFIQTMADNNQSGRNIFSAFLDNSGNFV